MGRRRFPRLSKCQNTLFPEGVQCLNHHQSARKAVPARHEMSALGKIRKVFRSDNGPELTAKAVQAWISVVGAQMAYITPSSSWENGYIERFNVCLRKVRYCIAFPLYLVALLFRSLLARDCFRGLESSRFRSMDGRVAPNSKAIFVIYVTPTIRRDGD